MVNKCNLVLDAICGLLFAAGWWMFIDGIAYADTQPNTGAGPGYLYVPGILTTIGFFLMSNLPYEMFHKDGWGDETTWWQKAILVLAVMCEFAGIIVGVWLYIERKSDRVQGWQQWRGVSSIVQGVLITIASFAWNFFYQNPDGW